MHALWPHQFKMATTDDQGTAKVIVGEEVFVRRTAHARPHSVRCEQVMPVKSRTQFEQFRSAHVEPVQQPISGLWRR
jgi:hypothetical protein